MPLDSIIFESFERSFKLYSDLIDTLDTEALSSKLPQIPSNSMGLQLWCVVGARESYAKAIQADEWIGFSCSLQSTNEPKTVAAALNNSATTLLETLQSISSYTDVQHRLMVDLLEHECSHQGQLIRYLYGLRLKIPATWKSKYALQ